MKIVHFDEMFHPDFGYQINVLPKYQAKMGHEVHIVTGDNIDKHSMFAGFGNMEMLQSRDRLYEKETGVHIVRLPTLGIISSRVIFRPGFVQYVDSVRPDVLLCHFHDTVAGTAFVRHVERATYPIVFDSHMLEMAARNRLSRVFRWWYRTFVTPTIIRNQSVIIRTQDDPYVQKCLGIPLSQAPYISFGTDVDLFKPDFDARARFRKEMSIEDDDFVVVYTGKLTEAKGGRLLAEAFKTRFPLDKRVVLVVVGNAVAGYGAEVEGLFASSENRVVRYPTQRYADLPKFYQAADFSIFPKQCSLSFFDAQACGLPVLSEDNGVNCERVAHGNGFTFKSGDCDDLRKRLVDIMQLDRNTLRCLSESSRAYVVEKFDYQYIATEYTNLLLRVRDEFDHAADD